MILAGNNTYLGPTNINAGTVTLRHSNALGTGFGSLGTTVDPGASVVVAEQGLAISELLTLNGNGVNNAGALQLSTTETTARNSTWSGAITLASNTAIGVGPNGQLTLTGVIAPGAGTASMGLNKIGSGRLILTNNLTYTGATSASAGELVINGTLMTNSESRLTGGTLAGVGTIASIINQNVSGSRLSPGNNGVGKLSTRGNVALNSTVTLDIQINGTTVGTQLDNLDVAGSVTLNNTTLSPTILPGFASTVGNQYQIITNDGSDAVVGTFNGLPEGATFKIGDQNFQITYKGGTNANDVVLTHVNTNSAFRERSITTLVGENGLVTLQGRIVEVDPKDTFRLSINWGDGTATERHTFPAGSNGKLVTLTHQYLRGRAIPYEVSLKWLDQHGGGNATKLSVQVSNIPPTATISGPENVNAGQSRQFTFSATDPADQGSKMKWIIDWGDGTSETLNQASRFSRSHKYFEPGDYTIRATATDRDGLTSNITTFRVHVESTINPASLLGDLLASGQI